MSDPQEKLKLQPPPGWAEANQALQAVFKDRGIEMKPCSVCGEPDSFQLNDGYFIAHTSQRGDFFEIGSRGMPLISLVCRRCGNTVFLNTMALGLGMDVFKRGAP